MTAELNALGEVGLLAAHLVEAERRVADAEAALSVAKENLRRIAEESLPGAMAELGVDELTLTDGSKISCALEVYCSIPAASKPAAFAWLTENGFGGLIKTEVSVPFGRDEDEKAMLGKLKEMLREAGYSFEASESVHAGTLKAWLKEQLRGDDGALAVPLQLFGARPVTLAKVKLPKARK